MSEKSFFRIATFVPVAAPLLAAAGVLAGTLFWTELAIATGYVYAVAIWVVYVWFRRRGWILPD